MKSASLLLLGSSFDPVGQSITIADALLPDMPIIYANKGFENFSGYTREEVIGKNCRFLQQTSQSRRVGAGQESVQVIRDAIAAKAPCIVDLINYKKNGSRFINRLSLRPIADASGSPRYYIGIQSDVTGLIEVANYIFKFIAEILKSDGGKGAVSSP